MTWITPRTWADGETVTAAMLNTHVRDNLSYLHDRSAAYAEIAVAAEVTATWGTSPQAVITCEPITADGSTPHTVETYIPYWEVTGGVLRLTLWDNDAELGRLTTLNDQSRPTLARRTATLTEGSHTLVLRALTTGTNARLYAGPGGAGQYLPAYLRVFTT